jgi:RND family efflux transporter MFP subunit
MINHSLNIPQKINMKPFASLIVLVMVMASCGGGSKEGSSALSEKKAQLETFKQQQAELSVKIQALEQEIIKLDPSAQPEKIKLVGVTVVETRDFAHYIDLQGRITTEQMYYVSPRGMGGQVKAVYVKQGDRVRKGQLLLKLDDAIIQQNIRQLENQLAFAKNIYERQQNLWKDGIGTEVQFLTARNNVENLEKQVAIVKETAGQSNVYAEVSGIAETVNIRVGEVFTGNPMAGITIVDPSSLKAVVDVPENYVARIHKGMPVSVSIPDLDKSIDASISLLSETINQASRSFTAESRMPAIAGLKPNQVAVVKILDHAAKNATVVPVETIQTDDKGKYVFVMREENGKKIARKIPVTVGQFYDEQIEVTGGISAGDKLVTRGFQGLYEGQRIDLVNN